MSMKHVIYKIELGAGLVQSSNCLEAHTESLYTGVQTSLAVLNLDSKSS